MCGDCLVTDVAITAITSTVGSGASVSTFSRKVTTPWRSLVKMTRRTERRHVRLEEIFNNNKNGGLKRRYLMIRRKSTVVTLDSRCGVRKCPHLLICRKPRAICSVFSSDAADEHPQSFCLWDWWNEDQQRQWLQVQPWESTDPWHRYGIVASRTDDQQNHSLDQWNDWNVGDWNR